MDPVIQPQTTQAIPITPIIPTIPLSKPLNYRLLATILFLIALIPLSLFTYSYIIADNQNTPEPTITPTPTVSTTQPTTTTTTTTTTVTTPTGTSTPTPSKAVEWNTYSSNTYKFSVEYPKTSVDYEFKGEWEHKEFPSDGKISYVGFRPKSMQGDFAIILTLHHNTTVDQIITAKTSQYANPTITRKDIVFAGKQGITVTISADDYIKGWKTEFYLISYDNKIYEIYPYTGEFARFTQTFKFL